MFHICKIRQITYKFFNMYIKLKEHLKKKNVFKIDDDLIKDIETQIQRDIDFDDLLKITNALKIYENSQKCEEGSAIIGECNKQKAGMVACNEKDFILELPGTNNIPLKIKLKHIPYKNSESKIIVQEILKDTFNSNCASSMFLQDSNNISRRNQCEFPEIFEYFQPNKKMVINIKINKRCNKIELSDDNKRKTKFKKLKRRILHLKNMEIERKRKSQNKNNEILNQNVHLKGKNNFLKSDPNTGNSKVAKRIFLSRDDLLEKNANPQEIKTSIRKKCNKNKSFHLKWVENNFRGDHKNINRKHKSTSIKANKSPYRVKNVYHKFLKESNDALEDHETSNTSFQKSNKYSVGSNYGSKGCFFNHDETYNRYLDIIYFIFLASLL